MPFVYVVTLLGYGTLVGYPRGRNKGGQNRNLLFGLWPCRQKFGLALLGNSTPFLLEMAGVRHENK